MRCQPVKCRVGCREDGVRVVGVRPGCASVYFRLLGVAGVLTPGKRMRIRIYGPTLVLMTQPVTPSGEGILSGETHLPR